MNEYFKNLWFNVKRTYLDTIALLLIIVGINYLPSPESGIVTLALAKLMFVSAGILHAHITRKIMWPYIDFNKDTTDLVKKVMIVVWYSVIILGWTRGG